MNDPRIEQNVTAYLEAANQHRLTIPQCRSCTRQFFPPRVACPYCLNDAIEFTESNGTGSLYSYSVVRTDGHPDRTGEEPYSIALVDLDDGPIIFSTVTNCEPSELSVGMDLAVRFEQLTPNQHYPVFQPI